MEKLSDGVREQMARYLCPYQWDYPPSHEEAHPHIGAMKEKYRQKAQAIINLVASARIEELEAEIDRLKQRLAISNLLRG